jgi:phosphatidylglycerol:prolipoprotein diacylglycerol transferase
MFNTLLHIYGPFSIHSFGLMLAIGLLITVYLAARSPLRAQIMSEKTFIDAIVIAVIAGLVGSRVLFVAQNWALMEQWPEALNLFNGGFSVLGSVIGVLAVMPLYLARHKVPLLSFFDLIAIYAPLLQAIARLGCFFAGCCFGMQTNVAWGITYTDPESFAPLCVPLHPTQLYSAVFLFGIFLIMVYGVRNCFKKRGYCLVMYLVLMSIERFCIDFFRGDREFFATPALSVFSVHQWISLVITLGAGVLAVYLHRRGSVNELAAR